jgi:hypothetical protein
MAAKVKKAHELNKQQERRFDSVSRLAKLGLLERENALQEKLALLKHELEMRKMNHETQLFS